jgi:hypothetical protein
VVLVQSVGIHFRNFLLHLWQSEILLITLLHWKMVYLFVLATGTFLSLHGVAVGSHLLLSRIGLLLVCFLLVCLCLFFYCYLFVLVDTWTLCGNMVVRFCAVKGKAVEGVV